MSTTSGNNSKNTILGVAAAIIIVLLGVNGYMIYNRSQLKTQNTELTADLDETTKLKEELNKQYYSALSELEGMRGTNEELNALIDQQKQELDGSKARIETLLKEYKENYPTTPPNADKKFYFKLKKDLESRRISEEYFLSNFCDDLMTHVDFKKFTENLKKSLN